MANDTPATETSAEDAWRRHDYEAVARIVLDAYGVEIYGFLLAQFRRDAPRADDVFSDFSEDFWRGLPKFEWRCSMRAWCYTLARNASSRYRRSPPNRKSRRVSFGAPPVLEAMIARTRTATGPHLRSEVKDRVQKLRDQLSREDQDILILRVDRNLSWREVTHVMSSLGERTDEERLRRKEASLRQRFADIKKRLRRLAEEEGLL